jgi:hypothetical protein
MGHTISKAEQQRIDRFVEAARQGSAEAVRAGLLDLNGANEVGDTALHAAAMAGHEAVAQVLLDQGTALQSNALDADNTTPFMLACANGHLSVAHLLAKSGCNVFLTDRLGWSALHHAAAGGHAIVVQWLLNKGLNAHARDSSGCSALWLAVSSEDPDSVRALLLKGADPDEINQENVSVYDMAKDAEDESVLAMVSLASDAWAEARGWDDDPREEVQPKDRRVLEGTGKPMMPVSDELDEDDDENMGLSNEEQQLVVLRAKVVQALALQDAFVDSHRRVEVS